MPAQDVLMVYTTFPDKQIARKIAKQLVMQKLAACANIYEGVTSIYEWQGDLVEEGEIVVLFKTRKYRFDKLSIELCKQHPYETPAVVGIDAAHVEANYLVWLHSQTSRF